ncbi:transcription factor IIA, alpha/beta subunit [Cokeromyces recurvatus]|uniref:transcription factor IIA, alpha/beta subunit n=1 Tax=Cokeromyces recurvatus TaxID=90255 RepID=UPI00221F416F|nr:transcription factor IIA, alpha/beta subunit [Cokeromyces recurvatus]KAI7904115.1 transcription factor IIA, alpha/beta subunit [Cokeromyces recurvatus]
MSNAIVSNVYRYVIDDVINQVRGDFEDMGIDDSILQELQRSWESKVARSRVANFGFKEDGYYEDEGGVDVSQSNDHQQAPLQYTEYNPANNGGAPPSAASLPNLAVSAAAANAAANAANAANTANAQSNERSSQIEQQRQQQQLPPLPPQQQYGLTQTSSNRGMMSEIVNQYPMMQPQRPQQNQNNYPDLYLPGIQRPNNNIDNNHLPQNDGANDVENLLQTTKEIDEYIENIIMESSHEDNNISFTASTKSGKTIDLDSLPDNIKVLMKQVKENSMKRKAAQRYISQLDGDNADEKEKRDEANNNTKDDEDINSDLDDSDDEDEDGDGGEEIEHIILCLYDKVTRTKNKWKCILKDGIMLVNGRDYLFHRANGDFEW